MVHLRLKARVPNRKAADVYPTLIDFERYPELVHDVRSVRTGEEDGVKVSSGEVNFHGGILRWKEEDLFLPEAHAIRFNQIEGDVDAFDGEWRVVDTDDGCDIDFIADFELGTSVLSALLEPIAEIALRANIRSIITGLLGPVRFE